MENTLSHLDTHGNPGMVDISNKEVTERMAVAQSIVRFPEEVYKKLSENQFLVSKGSILQTAIIAGTMAAKKTADLIPLCHPLPLSKIKIHIEPQTDNCLLIKATVQCEAKTGIEMEALTAASIGALTIYDMCKALSHDIVIEQTQLLEKKRGKNDFKR